MTEVVRPADGDPVALRPCPAWCAERRHFAGDMVIHADDGYHHYGTEAEVATSRPLADMAVGGDPVIVRYSASQQPPGAKVPRRGGTAGGRPLMPVTISACIHDPVDYRIVFASRSAVKKSSVRIPCACDRRNPAQPSPGRPGAEPGRSRRS
jgi:hypothetical protein